MRTLAVLCLGALCAVGCAHGQTRPVLPPEAQSAPAADPRCERALNEPSAVITELSGGEKAHLQQAMQRGAVAVEYTGCSLRVLSSCNVGGGYAWQRTGPATANIDLPNADAAYARAVLNPTAIDAEVRRAGPLQLSTESAGEYRLDGVSLDRISGGGECDYATHVVTSLSVGASRLSVAGGASGGRVLRGAGDPQSCAASTAEGPHPSCAAPLQVSLERVAFGRRGPEEPPPGMVQVEVVSDDPALTWDVYSDGALVCTSPCTQWLEARRPVMMKSRQRRERVYVPELGPEAFHARHALLVAKPGHEGKHINGLVFTTFGGMGMVVGITLTAVGCAEGGGACTGGLITLGSTSLVTGLGLWLLLSSGPGVEVIPRVRAELKKGHPPLQLALTPLGAVGTF